ncbi:unnamed protein product [Caenorhabditis bovis]|uniref:Uncharacterized protein n=1 Tax=Caenorhabditis bovis TaxID=2654633 RepID=A0A8S1EA31_9PELO|nr:unnamed protein product [Caenorhabditis bovis]
MLAPIFVAMFAIQNQTLAKTYYFMTVENLPPNFWLDEFAVVSPITSVFQISEYIIFFVFVYTIITAVAITASSMKRVKPEAINVSYKLLKSLLAMTIFHFLLIISACAVCIVCGQAGINSSGLSLTATLIVLFQGLPCIMILILSHKPFRAMNCATLVHASALRVKLVVPPTSSYFTFIKYLSNLDIFMTYLLALNPILVVILMIEDQYTVKMFYFNILSANVPPNFFSNSFVASTASTPNFKIAVKILMIDVLYAVVVSCAFPIVAYSILYSCKDSISEVVAKAHKVFLRSTLFTAIIFFVFVLIPFACLVVCTELKLYDQILTNAVIFFINIHGFASTTTLLITNKPYRKMIARHLRISMLISLPINKFNSNLEVTRQEVHYRVSSDSVK